MTTAKKLWRLLTADQHRAAILLLGVMLISMTLETLGIGLVIPALALMTQNDLAARYPALSPWLEKLGNPGQERLIVMGMFLLVVVYVVKTVFLAFQAWRQARFTYGLQANLSQRMFAGYLAQPYTFHLQRNSAQLIRNIQAGGITGVIQDGILLLAELLVIIGISGTLVAVEPMGAILVVSTVGVAGWAFSQFTKAHIVRWGRAFHVHEGLRIQHLQQGLGGAKDMKLLGREDDFLAQYREHNTGLSRYGRRQATLVALPRLWLELLAVIGLAALVWLMIWRGKPVDTLLPTLGLFAAASFRLMPSVNRVLNAFQNVRFSLPVIDTVYDELLMLEATVSPQRGKTLTFNRELVLDDVTFRYPAADSPALSGISLNIPQGASVGFIGGSGAGKSTLVDVILGLLAPSAGAVLVDGVDVQTNIRGWQDKIGYVPQSIFLTDDTIRRNVAFGLPEDQIDEEATWRALRAAQLEEFVSELPGGLDTLVGERGIRLSGGQRQRIGIARALYHDPQVLVLDEATSSLDTETESGVMDAVRALHGQKTLIIVAHRLSTVAHCDTLFRLEAGRLVAHGDAEAILGAATRC